MKKSLVVSLTLATLLSNATYAAPATAVATRTITAKFAAEEVADHAGTPVTCLSPMDHAGTPVTLPLTMMIMRGLQ
ncbi:hypothetical protein [Candidatus Epulonipiscium viviparus]|uniref:hypothetical protein n=1 Tax=Candidatus Epulonipiscium viviparus TaxID=420336 RepID=UPI0027381213|nr:hypothetical protein [Candidatus Epulopiscium viviparus]